MVVVKNARVGMKKILVIMALFLVFDCFMRYKMNNQIRRYARYESVKYGSRNGSGKHRF